MNPKTQLKRDQIDPQSHNDEDDLLDFVHGEQIRVARYGHCIGGCKRDNLITAWSCAMYSGYRKAGHGGKLETVCRYSRMPCPNHRLGRLLSIYSNLQDREV